MRVSTHRWNSNRDENPSISIWGNSYLDIIGMCIYIYIYSKCIYIVLYAVNVYSILMWGIFLLIWYILRYMNITMGYIHGILWDINVYIYIHIVDRILLGYSGIWLVICWHGGPTASSHLGRWQDCVHHPEREEAPPYEIRRAGWICRRSDDFTSSFWVKWTCASLGVNPKSLVAFEGKVQSIASLIKDKKLQSVYLHGDIKLAVKIMET